jgi:L-fuculose-phosphate aldolase
LKLSEARRAVAFAYKEIARLGLNVGSAGNVSARTPKGMVITPSGCSADTLTEAGLVAITLDGAASSDIAPSSEWSMHAGIYRGCLDADFIIHTHADACTALASLNEPLPPFHYMILQFGGADVRCAPYTTFGTPELADSAARAMQGRNACLLANHGMIVHGSDPAQAMTRAIALETLCRQYLLAKSAGVPRLLTDAEIEAARERFKTYGGRKQSHAV